MILAKLASVWGPLKTGFEKSVGLSADAIHVHVGVMLLFFFAWVTRRPLHDWRTWLMVFAVELANEIIDLRSDEHTSELQSLMRISYAVICLKQKNDNIISRVRTKERHHVHKVSIKRK